MSDTMQQLPSLTEYGWISNTLLILERVFVYYISTNSSQTSIFLESQRPSLRYVLNTTSNDPEEIASRIKTDLLSLLDPYFPQAEVETDIEVIEFPHYKINIAISVVDIDNNTVKLVRNVEVEDNEIYNYLDLLSEKLKLRARREDDK